MLEDEYTQLHNLAQRNYTRATTLKTLYEGTVSAVNSLHNANDRERKAHANTKRVTTRKINMERKAHANTKRVTTRKINKLKKQLESRR